MSLHHRCALCDEPFMVVMNEHGQLVDPEDGARPADVTFKSGKCGMAHNRCLEPLLEGSEEIV